jgi:hypothetical protein
MRIVTGLLLALGAFSLSACGGKDGAVGTWELDANALWTANREMVLKQGKDGFDQAAEGMKQIDAMPAEQREMARKRILEQAPSEHREILEAYLRSPKEAMDLVEKQARAQLSSMKVTVVVKDDGTYESKYQMGGEVEPGNGTWKLEGDQFTLTRKTKNGKPVEGKDARSWTLTLKGDTLSGKPEANGPTIALKRK